MYARSEPLGNVFSDVVDFFTGGGGGGSLPTFPGGSPPPGAGRFNTPANDAHPWYPAGMTVTDYFPTADDLSTIQQWKDAVLAEGGYPTRMPVSMQYAGELAERSSGPDTDFPNAPWPWTYTLAPANVIAADHRVQSTSPQSGDAIIPATPDRPAPGTPGVHWWDLFDWKKYALWGAIGVGVVFVAPAVLPALMPRPRRNPPRRRRRRRA